MPIRDEYIGDYDVGAAFKRIEDELIDSMMRNLARHNAEEAELGFDWTQWQAEQMEALERYRRQNEKLFPKRFEEINRKMEKAIMKAAETGKNDEEINILQTLRRNKKLRDRVGGEGNIKNGFFVTDNRKLDALVNATTNDMQRAEYAVLRRCNDQYRKIIFDAQVYYDTGAGTFEKALDMATHDFLSRGIDSIEYKNGARHTISDYADMVLKTTETRAYLTGQGQVREAWGEHLVIVAKRQGDICCPKCLPWVGRVLVDDVYSGGKPDGKHKTLSEAMAAGFLHPRCRDIFTTYFLGISSEPFPALMDEEVEEAIATEKLESRESFAKRQAEKYQRLANNALDEDAKRKYSERERWWSDRYEQSRRGGGGYRGTPYGFSRDQEQHIRYRSVLGELVPETLEDFQQLKYNDTNAWDSLKAKYRIVNRYDVSGFVDADSIVRLDRVAIKTKRNAFDFSNLTGDRRKEVKAVAKRGNAAVLEVDGNIYFSHSRADLPGELIYDSYKGDLPLIGLSQNRRYEVLDLGDGIPREVDTEAKFFEFLANELSPTDEKTVTILSEKHMCDSCAAVMAQFKQDFPNVNVNVVSGRKGYNGSKEGTRTWKHRN